MIKKINEKIMRYLTLYSYKRAISEMDRLNYIKEKNKLIEMYKKELNNEPETS